MNPLPANVTPTVINPADTTLTISGNPLINQSMASSFTSDWIPMTKFASFAVGLAWTGTPVGNFSLNASTDSAANTANVTPTQVIAPISGTTQAAGGGSGSYIIAYQGAGPIPYNWIQLVYTASSSTGVLTIANINAK